MLIEEAIIQLESLMPPELSESWDNTGLLIGDLKTEIASTLICLTIDDGVIEEARSKGCNLIVTHHPFPFKPFKRITSDNISGRMLLKLTSYGIAVYSGHTSYDSAKDGINEQITQICGLDSCKALRPHPKPEIELGSGRYGKFSQPMPFVDIISTLRRELELQHVKFVGDLRDTSESLGVACGSAGEYFNDALRKGCDVFVTGEMSFHTCLEAKARNLKLILLGHFHSERFAMKRLSERLAEISPTLKPCVSLKDPNPIQFY